ncbi:MAG: ABC transporter substrate-binding protein [Lachnospiraceae bacterium]|nr:ABC transporter substrate-binding protein [Lachnospiraceae bacterium]
MRSFLKKAGAFALPLLLVLIVFTGCAGKGAAGEAASNEVKLPERFKYSHSLELDYATGFDVDFYEGGEVLITLNGKDKYLGLPEGESCEEIPGVTIFPLNSKRIYLASSSVMDFFRELKALENVRLTSTRAADWDIPEIKAAVENEDIVFVGPYRAPDYEYILEDETEFVIENTMIFHTPEVKEKLEEMGLPVMVEYSSYEKHPLGRLEWIKLYGVLTGKLPEAEEFFDSQVKSLDETIGTFDEADRKTMAFFYINTQGIANVKTKDDYVPEMIEMAGGRYIPDDVSTVSELGATGMNMQMEEFYDCVLDADFLVYNSSLGGNINSIEELVGKSKHLADFKAVKEGRVWCTNPGLYQQPTAICRIISEFNKILNGDPEELEFFRYVQ